MSKTRSRNYPSLSLGDAIERARAVYKQEGRAQASADVAVQAWGYNSLNGASMRVLSAVRQYGLLEGTNEAVRLTPRALTLLLEPETHPEYAEALHEALQAPALFAEITEEYGQEDLPSDPALISWLVRKQNFSEGAAKTLIEAFRASIVLVRSKVTSYIPSIPTPNATDNRPIYRDDKSFNNNDLRHEEAGIVTEYTWNLSGNIVATLRITGGPLSPDDVEELSDVLDLAKKSITRKFSQGSTSVRHDSPEPVSEADFEVLSS